MLARVMQAGEEILRACVDAGGSITGEHGVGIEKREYMRWLFTEADLQAMRRVKDAFDPTGLLNPKKLLPDVMSSGAQADAKPPAFSVRPRAGLWS
jgi:FAD/FMN-containing dehydrogenase